MNGNNNSEFINLNKLKIEIHMHEYDTLRSEIVVFQKISYSCFGFVSAAFLIIITTFFSNQYVIVVLPLIIIITLLLFAAIGFSMNTLGEHVCEIEKNVNKILGEKVLTWELEHGWAVGKHSKFRKAARIIAMILTPLFLFFFFIALSMTYIIFNEKFGIISAIFMVVFNIVVSLSSLVIFMKFSKFL